MLLLAAFAVPAELQQRVLLYGHRRALVLRGVFIALGAAALERFTFTFLIFGLILLATAVKVFRTRAAATTRRSTSRRCARCGCCAASSRSRTTTPGPGWSSGRAAGGRSRPFAVVVVAVLATDVVFAVDSVPAVYGITEDPYLVFATNAFALLGLRALYFLLAGVLTKLVHLGYGLAAILAFIGVKLVLHWAHKVWPSTPRSRPWSASA
jgi:TerC family integral membrane protein